MATILDELAVHRRVALSPIPTAWVLTITLIVAAKGALASVEVGDSGNSHQSVWRVEDLGVYMDQSILGLTGGGEAIANALELWQAADSRLPRVWPLFGKVDALGYIEGQNNRNTIRFAAEGEPRAKGALAITLVTYDGEKLTIQDADIVINGAYHFGDNGPYSGQRGTSDHNSYDLGDVMAHEMGHFFGLPDNMNDSSAIMYPLFDAGETRRKSLSDADAQALDNLYSPSSANPSSPGACSVARSPQYLGSRGAGLVWGLLGMSLLLQRVRRNEWVARRPL